PPVGVLQAEQVVAGPFEGRPSPVYGNRVLYHVRAVMNSAIAVSSARTSPARSMLDRLALAAASCTSASDSAQSLPPAATTRSAARTRSASVSASGLVSRARSSAAWGWPLFSAATTGSDF